MEMLVISVLATALAGLVIWVVQDNRVQTDSFRKEIRKDLREMQDSMTSLQTNFNALHLKVAVNEAKANNDS